MPTAAEKAESFRALHLASRPFVLPNAWDVASARLFEDAGFPAVATSSAGVMVSRGYPDGQEMPRRELVEVVSRIASRLSVPVSADVVAGYGRGPGGVVRTVRQMLDAGAIGINVEDHDPVRDRLFPLAVQLRKIRAVRELGTSVGLPIVINARTDALWKGPGTPEERFREAVRRCRGFRDAGADCVYPMRLTDAAQIESFVSNVEGPVNVMIRAGLPSLPDLERLGVRRISFGPAASYAALGFLRRACAEIRANGSFASLVDGAISFDELNQLARARPAPAG